MAVNYCEVASNWTEGMAIYLYSVKRNTDKLIVRLPCAEIYSKIVFCIYCMELLVKPEGDSDTRNP